LVSLKVPAVADRPTGELGGIDLATNCFTTIFEDG